MSKDFTRIGKRDRDGRESESGPNPDTNARLRAAMQNAKGVNMPKDRVEAAIKRASSKEEKDFAGSGVRRLRPPRRGHCGRNRHR